jgi:hypothetical protein
VGALTLAVFLWYYAHSKRIIVVFANMSSIFYRVLCLNSEKRHRGLTPVRPNVTPTYGFNWLLIALVFCFLCALPPSIHAMTAREILDQIGKQNFNENFRMSLIIKTSKGNKVISNHVLWFTAKVQEGKSSFFLDFEQPRESKGLRFLFLQQPGKEPSAFMYLPATGRTVPLAIDDPSVDVGGTGLTTEDLQGFIQQTGSKEELLREDKLDGRDCYVIRIPIPENKGERLLWISKDGFLVLKNQQLDAQGKIVRTFTVTQFFKTDQGKDFPRQEEVVVPSKGVRISVKQEFAVFGIEVPEEVMDPEKFGTFQWKG